MQIIIWVDNFRQCRKVSVCKYEPKTGQANFWELIESKYKRFLLGKIIHDTELMRKKQQMTIDPPLGHLKVIVCMFDVID